MHFAARQGLQAANLTCSLRQPRGFWRAAWQKLALWDRLPPPSLGLLLCNFLGSLPAGTDSSEEDWASERWNLVLFERMYARSRTARSHTRATSSQRRHGLPTWPSGARHAVQARWRDRLSNLWSLGAAGRHQVIETLSVCACELRDSGRWPGSHSAWAETSV